MKSCSMLKTMVIAVAGASSMTAHSADISFGGAFEFDSVSTKSSGAVTETANDLSTVEVVINTELDKEISSSITLEATDSVDDDDSTVDDGVNVSAATLTFAPADSTYTLTVGLDTAPVGQFSTLSTSDPLALVD